MRGGKTFSDLAASSHRNLSIVFKDWSIRYNTPGGMKEVVKTAQVTETAKNLLESIKPGEQMVLDITEEMGCNVPIVKTATVEADLNSSAGLEQGMVVWRDLDKSLHVAFSNSCSLGIGLEVEIFKGVVSAAGQVEGEIGRGCVLTLKKEKEEEFWASIFMGKVPPEERAMTFLSEHCSEVNRLKSRGVGGEISVGVNVLGSNKLVGEYLGFGASAKVTGHGKWETTENRTGKALTVTSDCSMSIAVNLEPRQT